MSILSFNLIFYCIQISNSVCHVSSRSPWGADWSRAGYYSSAYIALRVISPAVVQNPDISSGFHPELRDLTGRAGDRFARQSARRRPEQPLSRLWPLRAFGRGCCKFELPADLLGILLGKGSRKALQTVAGQRRSGRRSAVGARLGGLSDFYEPYLLQKRCPGIGVRG